MTIPAASHRGRSGSSGRIAKTIIFALFWMIVLAVWMLPRHRRAQSNDRFVRVPTEADDSHLSGTSNTQRQSGDDPFALVNGVHYFADYDISKISQTPEVYPPLRAAESGSTTPFQYMDRNTSTWPFVWVSARPRVAYVPNFLSDSECDAVIGAAAPSMARSQVVPHNGGSSIDNVRTSSQTWLPVTGGGIGATIAKRIYRLIGFPEGSSEMLQVLRYEKDQKYDAHLDYFDPAMYGPQTTNRAVTVYLYLTDVDEGGHTWFPDADGKPLETSDYKSCRRGFGMKPQRRAAVVFYDMKPNGEYDPWSLHGSCPVKRGVKWGGTLWFRVPTK